MGQEGAEQTLRAMASLATPMAIRVAATLHIADHAAAAPRTAEELAEKTDAHAPSLERMLRHLVTVGVLIDEQGRYSVTALGDVLRDEHPSRLRRHLDIEASVGRADLSFVHLLHTVRTGQPAFPVQYGRTFWEDLSANEALAASFDALMGADVAAEAPDILSAYDWGSLGSVVDVGGGNGTLLIAMLSKYPTLHGTVVELPGAAHAAQQAVAGAGLAERAEAISSSLFDPLPAGAGGYVLSAVLHNWDDPSAQLILQRCAEAAGTAGAVFVIERMGSDAESPDPARDLQQLVYFGGRDRGLAELTALAADAGLMVADVLPAGVNTVLKLVPLWSPQDHEHLSPSSTEKHS
jgi:hypothetical protein